MANKQRKTHRTGIDSDSITEQQKREAILAMLEQRHLLRFDSSTTTDQQDILTRQFVILLLDELKKYPDIRRNVASELLFGTAPIMLHAGKRFLQQPIVELRDDDVSILHLYQRSPHSLMEQLRAAMHALKASQPIDTGKTKVTLDDIKAFTDDKRSNKPLYGTRGNRSLYNPKSSTSPYSERAHTHRDLRIYGQMRCGSDDSDEHIKQHSYDLENHKNITQNQYERILESAGGRFIWKKLHEYLLDKATLKEKTPQRWFRDMCVLCGLSTPALERITGWPASTVSNIQNENRGGFAGPHSIALQDRMRQVLSICLTHPIQAGRNLNASELFMIPAGSLFELPTITVTKGGKTHTQIDHKAVEAILAPLFGEYYQSSLQVMEHIKLVSDTYMQGAISYQELTENRYIPTLIKQAAQNYRDIKTIYQYTKGVSSNTEPVVEWLENINIQQWHLPEHQFNSYIEAFQKLPATVWPNALSDGLTRNEAFKFAELHHSGTVGSFLTTYRKAMRNTLEDIAKKAHVTREPASQYERGDRTEENTIKRALSRTAYNKPKYRKGTTDTLENLWQLPEDKHGNIRPDVVNYLEHFDEHRHNNNPQDHWLTINAALQKIQNRKITGKHAQALIQDFHNNALQHMSAIIAEQLAESPDDPFPMVNLPNGKKVIMRHVEGDTATLLDTDLPKWRDWLLSEAQQKEHHHGNDLSH